MQPGRSIEAAPRGAGCIQQVQPCVCHPVAERAECSPCPDDCARCGNAQRIRSGLGEAIVVLVHSVAETIAPQSIASGLVESALIRSSDEVQG